MLELVKAPPPSGEEERPVKKKKILVKVCDDKILTWKCSQIIIKLGTLFIINFLGLFY